MQIVNCIKCIKLTFIKNHFFFLIEIACDATYFYQVIFTHKRDPKSCELKKYTQKLF